jgi:glycosyltransferase involved in cell wall biosynthesis
MNKLIRITTVPVSLKTLLKGQHKFMSENGFDVLGVSSSGIVLNEVAQNEKIAVYTVEMTRIISPLKDIKSLWSFYKLCKRERPAIVHSHTPKAGIVGMLGAKLAGVPIRLHTVAGLPLMEATGRKRRLLDFVEKLTYSCATKVYPNSKGLYDFILENNFTAEEKLKVIANGSSNGIDTTYFSAQAITQEQIITLKTGLGIHKNDFVYVFVGRLVGDKGINELVKAFEGLGIREQGLGIREQGLGTREQGLGTRDEGLDESLELPITSEVSLLPDFSCSFSRIKLLLVGPFESELDPLRSKTLKAIETNPNIISVGFQADVRPYFSISDCLVFPSYREGFPNVVLQAGAMGLPSIVTNINGCNEIIEEGINGLIIPPKDIIALQNAMINLLEDKSVYKNLKNNARQMITSRYEQKLVWEALLEEYRRLLEGIRD